jgi:formylglycine-generating enzyme required for sulfatase activity
MTATALVLAGCPTDGSRDTFDYLRSAVNFRIDPVAADHPFCLDPARRMNLSEQACKEAAKYRLRWDRPEDTVGFNEYRIYLDTMPQSGALTWQQMRGQRSLASFVFEGAAGPTDSIIFILSDTGAAPRVIDRASQGLVPFDTSGRLDAEGRLVFGVVTGYRDGGIDGLPAITWAITNDRFAPSPLSPVIKPKATSLSIEWDRPRDPTSFFNPGADSGIVLAYYLRVVRGGILNTNRPGGLDSLRISYSVGGIDRTAEVTKVRFTTLKGAPGILYRLPDSSRVRNRSVGVAADSMRVTLTHFSPQDTVDIRVWAMDTARNINSGDTVSSKNIRILLTDTTQPTKPSLTLLSRARNQIVYSFTASRDLIETGSGLTPAPTPHANIEEYRISRQLIAGPTGGLANRDTIMMIPNDRRGDLVITDTARHLPPGATYLLVIQAVDSTGHVSEADSLTVSTIAPTFPGIESGATCPPGFVAITGGRFLLGDTALAAGSDEKPGVVRQAPSYCIETLEHRDNTGAFVTNVTWQQAHDGCRDLSQTMTTADSTWLCTEAEWERACEGAQPDVPLAYGMQSERRTPGEVRFTCNIGTGDSVMAHSAALRDPSCISYDGALDMSGNLAEWVLDPYTNNYPAFTDTLLRRGVPHTAVTSTAVRGFRGNHYLSPTNQSPATQLARSRCSNRDYATQSRPLPYAGCVSDGSPLMVVTYNNVSKPPRCLTLPDSIPAASIDTMIPARDSSVILILRKGVATPYQYRMPADSVYTATGLKPVNAGLTKQTLAIVTFQNSQTSQTILDTLNASELLGASATNQEAVFKREASPPWAVVKVGGVYQITYRYAHIQTRNAKAKSYYSNSAMGYRCCSKPRL